jgi:hypothetical protein
MNERMAPGHVYQPRLGTGIQWQPGVAKIVSAILPTLL